MKWVHKGHEYDEYFEQILKRYKSAIYIFGYGLVGKKLYENLKRYKICKGFIDNNEALYEHIHDGKQIMSLQDYFLKGSLNNSYIVITASAKNQLVIAEQLKTHGLVHGKHYFFYQEFNERILPIIAAYQFNETYVPLAQISVTERCTLKCKKCAHACYAVDNKAEDMLLAEVYKSADCFFSKVDYIEEFVLIGGEPLLYKQLAEAIEYIGKKYRKQMQIFCITTNGTIVPTEEVLKLCVKYNVLFRISNYTRELPQLENHHKRLIEMLENYGISYVLAKPEIEWMDYGFEYVNRENIEADLIKVFSSCNTPCREVRGNRYYYCVMARSVSENLGYDLGKDDYLDLNLLDGKDYKKELLEFNLGYSEKGYLDMCRRCHGNDAKNYPIPVAEQVKK